MGASYYFTIFLIVQVGSDMPPRPCAQFCFVLGRFNVFVLSWQVLIIFSSMAFRSSRDLCVVNLCEDITRLWLCDIYFCSGMFITARIRRSIEAPPETVQIFAREFFARIHKAFSVVSVFWMSQVLQGTQRRTLSPVSRLIQRECSWVFALDTSHKGAFYLRFLLGGVLGYHSLSRDPEKKIRLRIVRRGRSLPVFQKIVDCTHVAR